MTSASTIPAAAVPNSATNTEGRAMCRKLTAAGTWVDAPAPWPPGKAQEWFNTTVGQCVLTTHHRDCADYDSPAIQVNEVPGVDSSSSEGYYVGLFQGLSKWRGGEPKWAEFCFLLEPPAIAKLIAEFAALLKLHPEELRTPAKPPRQRTKRNAQAPKRKPLAHISAG